MLSADEENRKRERLEIELDEIWEAMSFILSVKKWVETFLMIGWLFVILCAIFLFLTPGETIVPFFMFILMTLILQGVNSFLNEKYARLSTEYRWVMRELMNPKR